MSLLQVTHMKFASALLAHVIIIITTTAAAATPDTAATFIFVSRKRRGSLEELHKVRRGCESVQELEVCLLP